MIISGLTTNLEVLRMDDMAKERRVEIHGGHRQLRLSEKLDFGQCRPLEMSPHHDLDSEDSNLTGNFKES